MRTGWVYRSDAAPEPPEPAPAALSWAVAPGRARTRRFDPAADAPQPPAQRGWIESGLYVVTLPVAITVGMMLAPVIWILGSRSRH